MLDTLGGTYHAFVSSFQDSVLDGAEMARQSIEVLKPRLEKVQKRMQSGEEAELSTLDKMALPLGLAIFALHDEMVGEAEESEQLVKKTIKHTMEAHDGPKFWGWENRLLVLFLSALLPFLTLTLLLCFKICFMICSAGHQVCNVLGSSRNPPRLQWRDRGSECCL